NTAVVRSIENVSGCVSQRVVAQTGSLLCRRLATCAAEFYSGAGCSPRAADCQSAIQQTDCLRYEQFFWRIFPAFVLLAASEFSRDQQSGTAGSFSIGRTSFPP